MKEPANYSVTLVRG